MGGFLLDIGRLAAEIHEAVVKGETHAGIHFDAYARPDFNTGMSMVLDPVDKAVVYFVGSRAAAQQVYNAAQEEIRRSAG